MPAEGKTARMLCTFLISDKARQVKYAKLFEVFYTLKMHSIDGLDSGPIITEEGEGGGQREGEKVNTSGVSKSWDARGLENTRKLKYQ